jgi:Retroviral aspartyl protease
MQTPFRVPVVHLGRDGRPSGDHVHAPPCIEVLYSFKVLPMGDVTFEARTWALLDTGADINLIDAARVPAHARFDTAIDTLGATGSLRTNVYLAQVLACGSEKTFDTQFIATPSMGPVPYGMILGRLFLRYTRFVYDRANGITQLEIY